MIFFSKYFRRIPSIRKWEIEILLYTILDVYYINFIKEYNDAIFSKI